MEQPARAPRIAKLSWGRLEVEVYNRLQEREPVGGLFHSTC